ncbi:MAG: Asp-tRNA(Asn)/Glu-tRNA(Gln) amidotransferase GatCAB subunit B, partial [Candidatus Hydrogenedentota bacterium]
SRGMRSKEESHDYRYVPDPDLVAFHLADTVVREVMQRLPEAPGERASRFTKEYGLSGKDAGVLTAGRKLADFFEQAVKRHGKNPKGIANWIISEFLRELPDNDPTVSRVTPEAIAELVILIDEGTISGKIAKDIFPEMVTEGTSPRAIVQARGLLQITDESAIEEVCRQVLADNPGPVEQYKGGKKGTLGFLVGAVMKKSGGKANPPMVNKILTRLLES